MRPLPIASCLVGIFLPGVAGAAPIVIDNFEGNSEGHFNSANPGTASGTNRNLTAATADPSNGVGAQAGTGFQSLGITPLNPGTSTDFPTTTFRLRHLSGGGTITNNVNIGPDGYVGYFLKTTVPGLTTAISLDDAAALELGAFRNVIADGEWHLYQWNLDAPANEFSGFAGTAPNGVIDSATTVSIDSIFIQGPVNASPTPLPIFLDTVAYNTTGDLSGLVPEPSSAIVLLAGTALATRRRRSARRE